MDWELRFAPCVRLQGDELPERRCPGFSGKHHEFTPPLAYRRQGENRGTGSFSPSPRTKQEHKKAHPDGWASLVVSSSKLLSHFPVDFHFDVVVHVAGRISSGVQSDIATFGLFRIQEESKARFNIRTFAALAQFGRVVVVVVENSFHAFTELRIIGDLDNHVMVGPRLAVIVPEPYGFNFRGFFEINLNPLEAVHQFDEIAFTRLLVSVGDVLKLSENGEVIAAGNFFSAGEENRVV